MAEANENNTGNVTGGAEKPKTNVRYIHGVPIYTEPETSDSASAKDGIAKDGGSSNNPFAEIPHGGVSRKMKKRTIAVIVAIPIVAFLIYWFFIRFVPSVEVDGCKIFLTTKVKEIDKMGLVLMDSDGSRIAFGTELKSGDFYGNTFEVFVNGDGVLKKTGVYVMIFNGDSKTKKVEDCSLYMIRYYPRNQDSTVTVLVNGSDISKMTQQTMKENVKAAKIPFNDSEMNDLLQGRRNILTGLNTMYRYELEFVNGTFRFELQSNVAKY